jgi:hypothetical protein
MNKLGRLLLFGLGLGAVIALAGHFSSGTIRAVDLDLVKVVNSASNPVPVPESESGSERPLESGH